MDLENMGAKNTLLVTDPNLVDLKPTIVACESMTRHKQKFTIFDKVKVEPTDKSFKQAIEFARKGGFDSFVAVGGGRGL